METNRSSGGGVVVAAVIGVLVCITVLGAVLSFTSGTVLNGPGSVISGIGNSGNVFSPEPPEGRLADLIVDWQIAGPIDDADLRQVYDAVLAKAMQGDADAALVIFEIADRQRAAAQEVESAVDEGQPAESFAPPGEE